MNVYKTIFLDLSRFLLFSSFVKFVFTIVLFRFYWFVFYLIFVIAVFLRTPEITDPEDSLALL